MGLVVVARFSVLGEAQIARSALESSGIFAVVMDEGIGLVNYMWSAMVQGFRLCVAAEDAEDAAAILIAARTDGAAAGPSDIQTRTRSLDWILVSLIPWALVSPYFALLFEATRRRPTAARYTFLIVVIAVYLLLVLSMCAPRPDYY